MDIRKELSENFVKSLSTDAMIKTWCFLIEDHKVIIELEKQGVISYDYSKALKLIDNENNVKIIQKYIDNKEKRDNFKSMFEYTFDLHYSILVDGSEITLQVLEAYTKLNELERKPESKVLH